MQYIISDQKKKGWKFQCCIHIFTLGKDEKDWFLVSYNILHKKVCSILLLPQFMPFLKTCVKTYMNSCVFWALVSFLHKNQHGSIHTTLMKTLLRPVKPLSIIQNPSTLVPSQAHLSPDYGSAGKQIFIHVDGYSHHENNNQHGFSFLSYHPTNPISNIISLFLEP